MPAPPKNDPKMRGRSEIAAPKSRSGSRNEAYAYQFANVNLTAMDKEIIGANLMTEPDEVTTAIRQLVEDGYKVTISAKKDANAVVVTFTHVDQGHPNNGWLLSSFGPDLYVAMTVNIYKHYRVCTGGRWADVVGSKDAWG